MICIREFVADGFSIDKWCDDCGFFSGFDFDSIFYKEFDVDSIFIFIFSPQYLELKI